MCGIVGYVGARDSVPIILEALERLEYRGYDSAGIAVIDERGTLCGTKAEGKLERLAERLRDGERLTGRIAVVHNGILENYAPLRAELVARGHVFTSETDTEVISHLIESHYRGDL